MSRRASRAAIRCGATAPPAGGEPERTSVLVHECTKTHVVCVRTLALVHARATLLWCAPFKLVPGQQK